MGEVCPVLVLGLGLVLGLVLRLVGWVELEWVEREEEWEQAPAAGGRKAS